MSITAEAVEDRQALLKGPEEVNLTFTFVFTITLEPIRAFTAIILQITETTTKISDFVSIFFYQKQNRILLIIWQF
jgi:hypothetical protein